MTPSQRIIVNTVAQYVRTLLNVFLSLYSTRLILAALGQTDFGIYSVVAGVVAMLAFMTNALVSTTQRYLSFHHGKGDREALGRVFGNSMLLHILIGISTFVLLGALTHPILFGVLKIEAGREMAAVSVYLSAVVMLMLTFITAPFRALFIARENIVYISVIDVLDGVFRLLIAIFLTYIASYDKLISYAVLLIGISVFNLLAFAIYALKRFEECHWPKWSEWDPQFIGQLSSFAGWTIYSTGCIMARTQGIAILLNRFFGSILNASYGIAQQVAGATNFVAASITNAMSPQIIKAEGNSNRDHMLRLAETASKYATLLLSLVAIPLVVEMPTILEVWLKEVPENAVLFCRFILIACVCDQTTIGLGIANQAIGNIRDYSLIVNTIKVLTLPAAWLCLHFGLPIVSVMWCYTGIEMLCALTRMPFLYFTGGLQVGQFIRNVFLRALFPIIVMIAASWTAARYIDIPYRFLLTLLISVTAGLIAIWCTALSKNEKEILKKTLPWKRGNETNQK